MSLTWHYFHVTHPNFNFNMTVGAVKSSRFATISVEMLLTIRARNISKYVTAKDESKADELVWSMMAEQKTLEIADACMLNFTSADKPDSSGNRKGILRVQEFQECLSRISNNGQHSSLTANEIKEVKKLMPRDPFGRIYYTTFPGILQRVRFTALKKCMLESTGTVLQKVLLEECKKGEEEYYVPTSLQNFLSKSPFVPSGLLSFRDVVSVLFRSPSVSLTRLHIHLLLSDATIDADRKTDYFQLVPLFANAVSLLMADEALREKEELIRIALDANYETEELPRYYSRQEMSALSECLLRTAVRLVSDKKETITNRHGVVIQLRGDDAVVTSSRSATEYEESLTISSDNRAVENKGGRNTGSDRPKSMCKLQVLHSPSTPCLLFVRCLFTRKRSTTIPCESVFRVSLLSGIAVHSSECFGLSVGDESGDDTISAECVRDWSDRLLSDVRVSRTDKGRSMFCIKLIGEEEEEEKAALSRAESESRAAHDKERLEVRTASARHRHRSCLGDESVFEKPRETSLPLVVLCEPVRQFNRARRRHDVQFEFDSSGVPSLRSTALTLRVGHDAMSDVSANVATHTPSSSLNRLNLNQHQNQNQNQHTTVYQRTRTPSPSPSLPPSTSPTPTHPSSSSSSSSSRTVTTHGRSSSLTSSVDALKDRGSSPARSVSPPSPRDPPNTHTSKQSLPVYFSMKLSEKTDTRGSVVSPCEDIVATAVSLDSTFTSSLTLPVKLPTLTLIDIEAAEEFVINLLKELYLEVPHDWDGVAQPQLKMRHSG